MTWPYPGGWQRKEEWMKHSHDKTFNSMLNLFYLSCAKVFCRGFTSPQASVYLTSCFCRLGSHSQQRFASSWENPGDAGCLGQSCGESGHRELIQPWRWLQQAHPRRRCCGWREVSFCEWIQGMKRGARENHQLDKVSIKFNFFPLMLLAPYL